MTTIAIQAKIISVIKFHAPGSTQIACRKQEKNSPYTHPLCCLMQLARDIIGQGKGLPLKHQLLSSPHSSIHYNIDEPFHSVYKTGKNCVYYYFPKSDKRELDGKKCFEPDLWYLE